MEYTIVLTMTVRDILTELEKPGRDPRSEFKTAAFRDGIESLSETLRLDDAPGDGPRSSAARVDANAGAARGPRDREPPREQKPGGVIALALERAKLKK